MISVELTHLLMGLEMSTCEKYARDLSADVVTHATCTASCFICRFHESRT